MSCITSVDDMKRIAKNIILEEVINYTAKQKQARVDKFEESKTD